MAKLRTTASTISDFVEWAEQIAELFADEEEYESPWFRGVTSSTFHLVPSLYRSVAGREKYADDELRAEFKRRGLPLVAERPPRDDWEWYSLMQHYGAPTRLLDWTDSALVALYFSISRLNAQGTTPQKAAVWALNPWKLNRKINPQFAGALTPPLADLEPYLRPVYNATDMPQYPIALDPTFIAQRMLVQHSHFTLHGSDPRGLDEMDQDLQLEDKLYKLVIRGDDEDIKILRQRVALFGISETTIFPDLTGLGRELSLEYDVL